MTPDQLSALRALLVDNRAALVDPDRVDPRLLRRNDQAREMLDAMLAPVPAPDLTLFDCGAGHWLLAEGTRSGFLRPRRGKPLRGLVDASAAFGRPAGHPLDCAASTACQRRQEAATAVEAMGFRGLASAIRRCRVDDGVLVYSGPPVETEVMPKTLVVSRRARGALDCLNGCLSVDR